jgi:TMEM175 potassium channel family protein
VDPAPPEFPLGRLEAFSDRVFAIAITLLVLELGVESGAEEHLLRSILHEWPSFLAYVTSFLTIGVIWMQHAAITSALRAADPLLYRINLLVLMLVSFLPFPTKLASEYFGDQNPERVAVVFYGLTLLALDLAMTAFVRYAGEHRRLVKDHVEAKLVEAAVTRSPSYFFYGGGIGLALLAPTVSMVFYLCVAFYLSIPARTLRRLLRGS